MTLQLPNASETGVPEHKFRLTPESLATIILIVVKPEKNITVHNDETRRKTIS